MNWKIKAAIQRACASVPFGKEALYRQLQLRCGNLIKGHDHTYRLGQAARMTGLLRGFGYEIEGASVMEVGTGWRLDMPIGLYLCGARRIVTCDLNRYLVESLVLDTVRYVRENPDKVRDIFRTVDQVLFETRLAALGRVSSVDQLFATAGIEYHAPCDCTHTGFQDRTIDVHYSYTVFEHIPGPVLEGILQEANRLLSDRGVAYHHIDLSDHFASVDPSITQVNFLRFSDADWHRYGGTSWSYHNRLRENQYRDLFQRVPQDIVYWNAERDERSLETLKNGFPLAPQYRDIPTEVLSTTLMDVISRPPQYQHPG